MTCQNSQIYLLFIQAMQFDNFEDWNDTVSCINFKFQLLIGFIVDSPQLISKYNWAFVGGKDFCKYFPPGCINKLNLQILWYWPLEFCQVKQIWSMFYGINQKLLCTFSISELLVQTLKSHICSRKFSNNAFYLRALSVFKVLLKIFNTEYSWSLDLTCTYNSE